MAKVTFFCRFVYCGKLPTKIKMPLNNKRVEYLEQTWFCWIVVLFLQMIKICNNNPMNIDVNTTFLLWISSFFLRLFTVLTTNIRRTIYSGNRNMNLWKTWIFWKRWNVLFSKTSGNYSNRKKRKRSFLYWELASNLSRKRRHKSYV